MAEQQQGRYARSFAGKRVLFCGIGVTHRPLIEAFAKAGAKVTAADRRTEDQLGEVAPRLRELGVTLRLGDGYLDDCSADVIFRTPGLPITHPALQQAAAAGIPITSEMEEFFRHCPARLFGVTGSDGKTTTTTLIAELLKAAGKTVFLGGNIGRPLLPLVEDMTENDCAVVELSSFQLMTMRQGPDVAVVTNVAPNHLDVHRDMAEYIEAKSNLVRYQPKDSITVLNAENEITRSFAALAPGQVRWFSHLHPVQNGCYLAGDRFVFAQNGEEVELFDQSLLRLPGAHNRQNFMAAVSAVTPEVSLACQRRVAETFAGVEHRIEFVRELNGARWYNDSIATSPTRAIAGLASFPVRQIIIAGGYDKHIPFEPFAEKAVEKIKLLILTGDTADKIEAAVRAQPGYNPERLRMVRAENLEEAVQIAYRAAGRGDVVSLSPACASFDRYPNFAERGRHFKALVAALPEKPEKPEKPE